jgi:diguanylate cyclase (GGDEF)-like protein
MVIPYIGIFRGSMPLFLTRRGHLPARICDIFDGKESGVRRSIQIVKSRSGRVQLLSQSSLQTWGSPTGRAPSELLKANIALSILLLFVVSFLDLPTALAAVPDLLLQAGSAAATPPAPHPKDDRKFHQFSRQHWSLEEGLPQVSVGALALDNEGFLWVGTQDGLARFDGTTFQVYDAGSTPGLAGNTIGRLAFDAQRNLWIGTRTGLSRFDGRVFKELRIGDRGFGQVYALVPTSSGMLVASDAGLLRADGDSLQPVSSISEKPVYMVHPRSSGSLLIGTKGQLRDIGPLGVRDIPLTSNEGAALPKLALEGCGGVWVASTTGLYSMGTEEATRFEALGERNVNDLYCDSGGVLWVATGSGIFLVRDGAVVDAAEDERRLPHPFVSALLPSPDGSLWMGTTTGGLYRLKTPRDLRIDPFDGVLRVDTAQSLPSRPPPAVSITGIRHGSRTSVPGPTPLELPAKERDVEFAFTAPVYDQPVLARFFYRLEGYDAEWKSVTGKRTVQYTNLPAGAYIFRVRLGVEGSSIQGTPAVCAFRIAPRASETWWFYALLIPIVGGIFYGAHAWRLHQVELRRKQLEKVIEERTVQLRDLNAELGLANQKLEEQNYTDSLTGLSNRRYLADRVGRDLAQLIRLPASRNLVMAFIIVDIDHFKRVNDEHGHEVGDLVLKEAAQRLKSVARETDYSVRWGGEELLFVACFAKVSSVANLVERLMTAMWSEPYVIGGGEASVLSGSAGFSVFPMGAWAKPDTRPTSRDWQAAIGRADYALDRVKQRGRNAWAGLVPGPEWNGEHAGVDLVRDADALIAGGVLQLVTSRPLDASLSS